jgi:hypothetical protein
LKIEDIEKLAFDTTDVTFPENTCAHCPMNVFESGIVQILGSTDECSEKNTFECPLLECYVKVRFGPVDIDE